MSRFLKSTALAGVIVVACAFLAPAYAQAKIEIPAASEPVPISRPPPSYPNALASKGIEGWVLVEFFVETDGSVSEIEVLDSDPPGKFERAAKDAVRKWEYAPAKENGVPRRMSTRVVLTFEMNDGPSPTPQFNRLSRQVDNALKAGNLKAALSALTEMEVLVEDGRGTRFWLNFLYYRYFAAAEDYPRAIHHLRHSLALPLDSYKRNFLKAALPTLFKVEVATGDFALAIATYERIEKAKILKKDDDIHNILERVKKVVNGHSPLNTKAFILGKACFECKNSTARWRYPLSRQNFQIRNLEGDIKSMAIYCKHERAQMDFDPDLTWTIADKWEDCALHLVGTIETQFHLFQFDEP